MCENKNLGEFFSLYPELGRKGLNGTVDFSISNTNEFIVSWKQDNILCYSIDLVLFLVKSSIILQYSCP